jgi:hypothetical protein
MVYLRLLLIIKCSDILFQTSCGNFPSSLKLMNCSQNFPTTAKLSNFRQNFPTSEKTFQLRSVLSNLAWFFPTSIVAFQFEQKLSNFIQKLSNLKLYNYTILYSLYNYTYPDFVYRNRETSTVQISVEHQSLLDSVLTRLKFSPNFTSILPWIRAKMGKTMYTTW